MIAVAPSRIFIGFDSAGIISPESGTGLDESPCRTISNILGEICSFADRLLNRLKFVIDTKKHISGYGLQNSSTTYKPETDRDLFAQKGYAVGFEGLISRINSQLPMNEVIGQALREDLRMFPELAILELVANALVHQDFEETGGSVMVEIYSDRIEIGNPGRPLISTTRFVDEYKFRNEQRADLMRRTVFPASNRRQAGKSRNGRTLRPFYQT